VISRVVIAAVVLGVVVLLMCFAVVVVCWISVVAYVPRGRGAHVGEGVYRK
jgi:hypothetical protein